MDEKGMTREYRLRQWTRIVSGRNESGKNVRDWCAEQGVNPRSYYSWQRRIRETLGEQLTASSMGGNNLPSLGNPRENGQRSCFTEITGVQKRIPGRDPAVTIDLCGTVVGVHSGADEETILNALRAVRSL